MHMQFNLRHSKVIRGVFSYGKFLEKKQLMAFSSWKLSPNKDIKMVINGVPGPVDRLLILRQIILWLFVALQPTPLASKWWEDSFWTKT